MARMVVQSRLRRAAFLRVQGPQGQRSALAASCTSLVVLCALRPPIVEIVEQPTAASRTPCDEQRRILPSEAASTVVASRRALWRVAGGVLSRFAFVFGADGETSPSLAGHAARKGETPVSYTHLTLPTICSV